MDQPAIPTTGTTPMVTTATTMVGPLPSEETFDKESIALTASSSLTLRTTSDDEMTTFDPLSMPNEPYQKVSSYFFVLKLSFINGFFLAESCSRNRFSVVGKYFAVNASICCNVTTNSTCYNSIVTSKNKFESFR
jgi:hypothetical protein